MQRADIINIVNEFLIDEFEIEESALDPGAHLIDDLGIESLDFVDIVVAFLFVVAKLIYSLIWLLQSFCPVFLPLAYNSSSWSIMVHA